MPDSGVPPLTLRGLCAPYAITFLHLLGAGAINPILALFVTEELKCDPWLLGLTLSVFGGAVLVSSVPGGVMGDRIGSRATVVFGISLLAVAGVTAGLAPSIAVFVLAMVLMGVGNAIYMPSLIRIISISTEQHQYGRTMSIYSVVGRSGGIVGPMLGGVLVALSGLRAPFFSYGLLTVLGTIIATSSLPRVPDLTVDAPSIALTRRSLLANLNIPSNILKAGLIGVIVSIASFGLVFTTMSVFYSRMASFGTAQIGALFSVNAMGAFVMSGIAGPVADRFGYKRLMALGLCMLAVTTVLLPFLTDQTAALAVNFLFGGIVGALNPVLLAYIAASSPSRNLGTAMGVFRSSTAAGNVVGPLLAGVVMSHYGEAAPFFLVALIALVGVGIPLSLREVGDNEPPNPRPCITQT